jgi:hypothetical protein
MVEDYDSPFGCQQTKGPRSETAMLKPHQILASEWAMLNLDKLEVVMEKAFPRQPERQLQAMEALHFFDAFLGVTDASIDHAFTPRSIVEFRGFLAAEVDMPAADSLRIVWAVGEWLVAGRLIKEEDVQFALSQDEAFAKRLYQETSPLPERVKYYSEWFEVSCGSFAIDLSYLDSRLSESSQQFLRDRLADYLRDKDGYQARTDVELIYSILQGYVTRWPTRELNATLSAMDTASFVAEINAESNRQMACAGFSRADARRNLNLVLNVVRHFFVRSGIFSDAGKG